ncbi:hypothetical protein [Burkholderia cenocepacia]|uniref:hypothetical protein n=1 Tax=Burkholderia cenocepacia TaxID=95486 RepID=UPI000F584421|nr:hypothetical protein [Burkholderia cenocepacia]RQU97763.1 hypothetical protein DF042_26965 [Burkholderia cenocepacia]
MADKKDYQSVLIAFDRIGTLESTLNQLTKVHVETEDKKLKGALEKLTNAIRVQLGTKGKTRLLGLPTHIDQGLRAAIEQVRKYCQAAIDSTDPQWVILARAAGWTPPASN